MKHRNGYVIAKAIHGSRAWISQTNPGNGGSPDAIAKLIT
jgi:hypothetical protein